MGGLTRCPNTAALMFIALCQVSHTGIIYTVVILLLMSKPVLAPLTGVTPDKISMQHKSTVAAKQNHDCYKGQYFWQNGLLPRQTLPCNTPILDTLNGMAE